MSFFFKFSLKPNVVMPIFGQKSEKSVNFVKITLDYMPKKSMDALFSNFSQKITVVTPIFWQKTYILGKQTALMPIFSKKTLNFQKQGALITFFKIFHEKPLLSCPYLVKNVNFVKTTQYYGPKKLLGCPFFPIFTKKSMLSCPYFVKKPSILLETFVGSYMSRESFRRQTYGQRLQPDI